MRHFRLFTLQISGNILIFLYPQKDKNSRNAYSFQRISTNCYCTTDKKSECLLSSFKSHVLVWLYVRDLLMELLLKPRNTAVCAVPDASAMFPEHMHPSWLPSFLSLFICLNLGWWFCHIVQDSLKLSPHFKKQNGQSR